MNEVCNFKVSSAKLGNKDRITRTKTLAAQSSNLIQKEGTRLAESRRNYIIDVEHRRTEQALH